MVRPDAQRVHAEMVQGVPGRDVSTVKLKGVPVGELLPPCPIALDVEVPVAVPADGPLPHPASRAAREFAQKALALIGRCRPLVRHNSEYTTEYTEHIGRELMAHLEAT